MRIFFSHSSTQKPLVREIKKNLPEHISAWLDEDRLIFGDAYPAVLEATIKHETDYVLLFLDHFAGSSAWVHREVEWALQVEKRNGRTILLPIVIDEAAVQKMPSVEFKNRKYLKLLDYQESSVRALSKAITSELFALICRDMHALRNPKPKSTAETITGADAIVGQLAKLVQKAVFPHREGNPISKEKLEQVIFSFDDQLIAGTDFDFVLSKIVHNNLIPGLVHDGSELFLREEHASWKSKLANEHKQKIAKRAASFVKSGTKLFLDAGSTAEEIATTLIKRIESHALSRLTIATTSINIADMFSDCLVRMGFDDDFCSFDLYVPGGRVRANTQAIVHCMSADDRYIPKLGVRLDGFDLGIVGVNGVHVEHGFTTHQNLERQNKSDIMSVCQKRLIVGDTSKLGIVLDARFADFSDDVLFITNGPSDDELLRDLVARHPTKVEVSL